MLKKIDALSTYYVNILEHILLLLKQISREQIKKTLLVAINRPVNSVSVKWRQSKWLFGY